MARKPEVAYADVFFGVDERGHVTVVNAYCVYEICEDITWEREVNELKIYQEKTKVERSNGEPEYYIMESEDEGNDGQALDKRNDPNREGDGHYDIQSGENLEDLQSHRIEGYKTMESSADQSCEEMAISLMGVDDKSTSSVRPPEKDPETLTVVGITTFSEDKILVVTESGEFIIFDSDAKFLFLREFNEIHQDLTTIDSCTIAATSGYCIKFYRVRENDISELRERVIDFEFAGGTTVHGIHYFQEKLAVSCNIQSVYVSDKPSIKILDLKGNVRQNIDLLGFKVPAKISCSKTGKCIFICDSDLNKVSCIKSDGRILWEKTEKVKPLDLELVHDSELYVLYENRKTAGLSAATGKLRSLAEICLPMDSLPGRLGYQKKKRTLFLCLEKLVVGSTNFILPLTMKKVQGKLNSLT